MSQETKHLWPAPGMKIRDEDTMEIIPPGGAVVRMTNLTYRRLLDKELLERDPRPKAVREAFPDQRMAAGVESPAPAECPNSSADGDAPPALKAADSAETEKE